VNLLDAVLVTVAIAAVVGGYRLGFTTRVLSWVGLAVGLVVGIRLLPWVVRQGGGADHGQVVILALAVVVAAAALGQAVGFWLGGRITPRARGGAVARTDQLLGGLAGLVGVIAVAWVILPVLNETPGWPSQLAGGSALATAVADHLPQAPDVSSALRSLVGQDNYPKVFDALQPATDVGAPPGATGLSDATARAVARSVVKVEGPACNRIQDGTGWVVADNLVVTNAHVVAGEGTTDVERDDGRRLKAKVVAFDPERDLALLQVAKLSRPALVRRAATRDETGGVFGHPGGEPLRIAPFRVARAITATGTDIYDASPTKRQVLELAASLRPGDSGSALVDPAGEVVGTAFAISTERDGVAYALANSELDAVLAAPHDQAVSTGSCIG
jgi:S1-C subfamily serine protease